jgi:hypothetical protein
MIRSPRIHLLPRALGAGLLLAALLLGALSHGWHHLVDHDCESGSGPSRHACVQCSSLHAAAGTGAALAPVVAPLAPLRRVLVAEAVAPRPHTTAPRSARAPPIA